MELSDFAEICANLNNEDNEVSSSALAAYNEFSKTAPNDLVSKLILLILQSESVFLPLILLKNAANDPFICESIGFQGFWSVSFPQIKNIVSKITSAEEMETFSLAIAKISVHDTNEFVQTVLPFIFEIICEESFFPFAITTLTNSLLFLDKGISLPFQPLFELATSESGSEDELNYKMKLFFSLIHHFSQIEQIHSYFVELPKIIPDTLVSSYLNQLLSLFQSFKSYFAVSIADILPFLLEYGNSEDEEITANSLYLLSHTTEFYSDNTAFVSSLVNTLLTVMQRVGDEVEWDSEEDMQTISTTAANLFSVALFNIRTSDLLDILEEFKGSNDMTNWKVVYSYFTAMSEINLRVFSLSPKLSEKAPELIAEMVQNCSIGQEVHPRIKVACLSCLINVYESYDCTFSSISQVSELIYQLILTKCEGETNIHVIENYFKFLKIFTESEQCNGDELLPVLEWCVSSLDSSSDLSVLIVSCIGGFFQYFGEKILPSFVDIATAFNQLLESSSVDLVVEMIDAISIAAEAFGDQMESKDVLVHFLNVGFEAFLSSDDETVMSKMSNAIFRFILSCGSLIDDTLVEMVPRLFENAQQEIEVVTFPIENNVTEVPGHSFAMNTEEESVFINNASENVVYSSLHIIRSILNSINDKFPDKEALIELCTSRITHELFSVNVSSICWHILEYFFRFDELKENAARIVVSLIPSSRVSYLSQLVLEGNMTRERNALYSAIQEAFLLSVNCIKENEFAEIEGVVEALSEFLSIVNSNLGDEIVDEDLDSMYDSPLNYVTKIFTICFQIFTEEMCAVYAENIVPALETFVNRSNGVFFVFRTLPIFLAASGDLTAFPFLKDKIIESLQTSSCARIFVALKSLCDVFDLIDLCPEDCRLFFDIVFGLMSSESVYDDDDSDFKEVGRVALMKFIAKYGASFDQKEILTKWFSVLQPEFKGRTTNELFGFFVHICDEMLPALIESVGANEVLAFLVYNIGYRFVEEELREKFLAIMNAVISNFGGDPNALTPGLQEIFAALTNPK